jgi:peptidoglycan hydrolase CwlO-like protein
MSENKNKNINNLLEENEILQKMLSEKDNLIININHKLLNIEDNMNMLIEKNNNMESKISRLMTYLETFTGDVRDELRNLKCN